MFENKKFTGLSIIMPAFNEGENIAHSVEEVLAYSKKLHDMNMSFEVLVVNDGSDDNTPDIINRLALEYPQEVVAINNSRNSGYGYSIAKAIEKSRYDLVFFTDADRQFKIGSLDLLLPLMFTGIPDIVIGYRLDRKDPALRKFLSWGFNSLVRFIFDINVKDIDCAFKLFRKEIFKKIEIGSNNFFINTEILTKAGFFNFRILEVGVEHFPRGTGKSTVSLKYIPLTLMELVKIWKIMQGLKRKRNP
ncbi:MAG: glycosyltransferase family 2 protein [Candidatus Omnitrophica bacterium]|nr:glycosyltransferase family 2 protein [Candidatus Omnitrophota bacterium]